MKSTRTAIALGAIGTTAFLALAPLALWASIILGIFLLVEIIALWAMSGEQP